MSFIRHWKYLFDSFNINSLKASEESFKKRSHRNILQSEIKKNFDNYYDNNIHLNYRHKEIKNEKNSNFIFTYLFIYSLMNLFIYFIWYNLHFNLNMVLFIHFLNITAYSYIISFYNDMMISLIYVFTYMIWKTYFSSKNRYFVNLFKILFYELFCSVTSADIIFSTLQSYFTGEFMELLFD